MDSNRCCRLVAQAVLAQGLFAELAGADALPFREAPLRPSFPDKDHLLLERAVLPTRNHLALVVMHVGVHVPDAVDFLDHSVIVENFGFRVERIDPVASEPIVLLLRVRGLCGDRVWYAGVTEKLGSRVDVESFHRWLRARRIVPPNSAVGVFEAVLGHEIVEQIQRFASDCRSPIDSLADIRIDLVPGATEIASQESFHRGTRDAAGLATVIDFAGAVRGAYRTFVVLVLADPFDLIGGVPPTMFSVAQMRASPGSLSEYLHKVRPHSHAPVNFEHSSCLL